MSPQSHSVNTTVSLDSDVIEVYLGSHDGLEDNQLYTYTVTAVNSIGNATSNEKVLGKFTSSMV